MISSSSLKGFLLIFALAIVATLIAGLSIVKSLALSPLIIGVLLGMLLANTFAHHIPKDWQPGIKLCSKTILRLSIVFYGFRLTLNELMAVGIEGFVIDTIVVVGTLSIGLLLTKWLRLDKPTGLLVSSGSAICGAAAVLATEPIVGGKSHQTVVAVATVVIFGSLSMFVYPLLYRLGLFDSLTVHQMGLYTGATIHEVAHVVGAGNAMGTDIAGIATITKMIRVILLAPTLMALGYLLRREQAVEGGQPAQEGHAAVNIPWFAFLFLGMVLINTLLTWIFTSETSMYEAFRSVREVVLWLDSFGLTLAMTAIGVDASVRKFREAGLKPFLLALGLYLWLTLGGYGLVRLIG